MHKCSHLSTDQGSTWAMDSLQRVYTEISLYEDGRVVAPDVLILSLELVYRKLLITAKWIASRPVNLSGEQLFLFRRCEIYR